MMCAFLRRLTTPWLADPRQPDTGGTARVVRANNDEDERKLVNERSQIHHSWN